MNLEQISQFIETQKGTVPFKTVLNQQLNLLTSGRRAAHTFVVKSNMRQLKSGPNRGKMRLDGVLVVMFDKKRRTQNVARIVRKSDQFLSTLDRMIVELETAGYSSPLSTY